MQQNIQHSLEQFRDQVFDLWKTEHYEPNKERLYNTYIYVNEAVKVLKERKFDKIGYQYSHKQMDEHIILYCDCSGLYDKTGFSLYRELWLSDAWACKQLCKRCRRSLQTAYQEDREDV